MEHYQPHNSIDPSLPQPPFFTTTTVDPPVISQPTPISSFPPSYPIPNQTSYDEMIMAAISALRERDGSSRQAIARYIDRVYTNLPSNHSILLTNHLKKLKNCGQLVMNKHSYLLPGSAPPQPPPPPYTTTQPAYSAPPPPPTVAPPFSSTTVNDGSAAGAGSLGSTPPSEVKKRGRPRKPKPDLAHPFLAQNVAANGPAGPIQTQYQNYVNGPNGSVQNVPNYGGYVQNASNGPNVAVQNVVSGPVEGSIKRRPGRPRKDHTIQAHAQPPVHHYNFSNEPGEAQAFPIPQGGAPVEGDGGGGGGAAVVQGNGAVSESEAMLVSLGLSDGPVSTKMRPRRAVKPTTASSPQPLAETGQKRRPGRPRKVTPITPGVWPVQVPVGSLPTASATSSGTGRGRGRPRKYPLAVVPANGGVNGVQVQHKKRGRKPKSATQDAGFSVPVSFMMPEQMNGGGGAMMPQTPYTQAGGAAAVAAASGGVEGHVHVPVSDGYNGVVHSVPAKRGRGRPPGTHFIGGYKKPRRVSGKPLGRPRKNYAVTPASEDQSLDIVNLKNKIDYLQSKIMEALPIIKSCINAEEPNVMGALGQLEELATADFTTTAASVNVQNQQQPPSQLLQAEHQ